MSEQAATVVNQVSLDSLLMCSRGELASIYSAGSSEVIPEGRGAGRALIAAGTFLVRPIAWYVRVFGWKGKDFKRTEGTLLNRVTPFGIRAIKAKVYLGDSLFDGGQTVVLDYSKTSLVARFVRDEIREVSQGVYLGYAYVFGLRAIAFALDFNPA